MPVEYSGNCGAGSHFVFVYISSFQSCSQALPGPFYNRPTWYINVPFERTEYILNTIILQTFLSLRNIGVSLIDSACRVSSKCSGRELTFFPSFFISFFFLFPVVGIESRASCMLDKHWAISPALFLQFILKHGLTMFPRLVLNSRCSKSQH